MAFPHDIFRHSDDPPIRSRVSATTTDSRGLITLSRELPGQRYEVGINGIVLPQHVNQFDAFLEQLRGPTNTFRFNLPDRVSSSATNKTTSADVTIGQSLVSLENTAGIRIGDMFNFLGSTKVYRVTGVTALNITFFPNITRNFDDGSTVNFQTPFFDLRLTSNTTGFENKSSYRHFAEYNFTAIEAL